MTPASTPGQPTELSTSRAETVFRLANALYQDHGEVLSEEEIDALRGLRARLTDILCPFPVALLDDEVRELDAKFPDREHWYIRCGKTVTWCDRPRSEHR